MHEEFVLFSESVVAISVMRDCGCELCSALLLFCIESSLLSLLNSCSVYCLMKECLKRLKVWSCTRFF